MQKIYITRQIPEVGVKMLQEKGYTITIGKSKTPPTQKELIKALKKEKYDAVITLLTDKIDKSIFNASPSAKIFANYAVGYDNLDLKEAKERGIHITNTPGDYVDGVAEHAIALLLGLLARIVEADKFIRTGKYKGWDPMLFTGEKLNGKVVAIIGTGRIGEQFAKRLHDGFGIDIIYHDIIRNERVETECKAKYISSLEETLKQADVVSLHVPLLPSTKHLINKERLAIMKDGVYIINTARGPVIDENALVEALKNGKVRGAGLDVFEFEPKLAKGLAKLDNVILTPHIASAQKDSRNEMSRIAAKNVIDALEGREPRNKVNK